jgi:hypothetical protein
VDAPARRDPAESGRDHLLGRVAEFLQMLQQVDVADRGIADSEGPNSFLVEPFSSQGIASLRIGLVLPEAGLEEFVRIGEQLSDSGLRDRAALRVLRDSDPRMLAERVKEKASTRR